MTLRRFHVRAMSKQYGDQGPDLLRTRENAVHQVGSMFGSPADGYFIRRNPPGEREDWGKWTGPFRRAEVLGKVDSFCRAAPDTAKLQVGRKSKGDVKAGQEVWVALVRQVPVANVNPGPRLVADLARAQFGVTVGGFNCREYNNIPGSGWSDHAWGDAVDLSGTNNDKLTDWCVRMAKEGLMNSPAQFIGSKGGKVYSFVEPGYGANLGGPVSHLTHVHCSYTQHYGKDPNCR